jgi:coenzyme F420-reducing hydrogenase alpha subunit
MKRRIAVDSLARVEGEGGLRVTVENGRVAEVKLTLFEPPRFFEAFLRGRSFAEAPDITARICGICPVAYQMSACHAMERALGIRVEGPLRDLRRLLYCGEWIQSHALHVYLLHAPDFLGYDDAVEMSRDHPEVVRRGLLLKKIGNEIMALLGGREIHPVNVRVGGFYRTPTRAELLPIAGRLELARDAALATVRFASELPIPEHDSDHELVALRHPGEYPFNEGRVVSSLGLDVPDDALEDQIVEEQVPHSNALHARLRDRGNYLVGPLARYALNFDRLSSPVREAALEAGLGRVCRNPFRSIVVRSVEILHACEEALRIVEDYRAPDRPAVEVVPRAGAGAAATEAPRGTLYHRYRLDEEGTILEARIIPPTSQNQKTIERDVSAYVSEHLDDEPAALRRRCEQIVRNHDPCISCATHFLNLEIVSR